jgi:L-fuculose-phosphate aldolase
MRESGLTVQTWGNISCLEDGKIYITPSAMDYGAIGEDDIVVMRPDGVILEGRRKPSIEAALHLAVYAARPDVLAIVHTHAIHSNIFACTGEEIPLFHDEAAQTLGDVVRVAPYALPGSVELAKSCVNTLGATAKACLLRNHGAVCVSGSMDGCFKVAAVLEMLAELYYKIRAMNASYLSLSDENIKMMMDFAKNSYGK